MANFAKKLSTFQKCKVYCFKYQVNIARYLNLHMLPQRMNSSLLDWKPIRDINKYFTDKEVLFNDINSS